MDLTENTIGSPDRSTEAHSDPPQPLDFFRAMQSLVNAVHSVQMETVIADTVLDHLLPLLEADLGVVAAVAEDGSTLEILSMQIATTDPQAAWTEFPLAASSPIPLCMHAQQTVILHNREEFIAICPEFSDVYGPVVGAALAIPLHLENRVRGSVGFFWREARPFPEWEVAFVVAAVTLAAQAVERTRRHEADLRDAHDATRETLFQALTKSEARLAQAQSVARIGSWEVDIASGTAVWSEEMFRILEFDASRGNVDSLVRRRDDCGEAHSSTFCHSCGSLYRDLGRRHRNRYAG